MPGDLISPHEVRLLLAFRQAPEQWLGNAEVAATASVSPRTARLHTARLTDLGVLDVERVYPASKFRFGRTPKAAGRAYLVRWEKARTALGIADATVVGAEP